MLRSVERNGDRSREPCILKKILTKNLTKMTDTNAKLLFKILLGAAWIDGEIQAAEREHLQKKASELGLVGDPEVKALLDRTQPVPDADCYAWLETYLGNNPTPESYQKLLEAVGATVYSDSNVDTAEARLLGFLQAADPTSRASQNKFLQAVRDLYRKAIA